MTSIAAVHPSRVHRRRAAGFPRAILIAATLLLAGSPPGLVIAQIPFPFLPAMEVVPDARSLGMGRAFTAVAEGPSAVWWNPGALGLPSPYSANLLTDMGRTTWIEATDLGVYAVSGRIRKTGVAFHLTRLGAGDYGFALRNWDYLAQVGAGVDLTDALGLRPSHRVRWGIGASVKRYAISFDDAGGQGTLKDHAGGFDLDAGSLFVLRLPLSPHPDADLFALGGPATPFAGIRLGAILRNAFDTRITLERRSDATEYPLGRVFRAGAAIEAGSASWMGIGPIVSGTLSAELLGDTEFTGFKSSLPSRTYRPTGCYGVEMRLLDVLSLRYGEVHDDRWDSTKISRGVGLRFGLPARGGIRIDWAQFAYPYSTSDTEQLSMSVWVMPW